MTFIKRIRNYPIQLNYNFYVKCKQLHADTTIIYYYYNTYYFQTFPRIRRVIIRPAVNNGQAQITHSPHYHYYHHYYYHCHTTLLLLQTTTTTTKFNLHRDSQDIRRSVVRYSRATFGNTRPTDWKSKHAQHVRRLTTLFAVWAMIVSCS